MIALSVLFGWMATGSVISVVMVQPDQPRGAWIPVAAILGPLWALIAEEQMPEANVGDLALSRFDES